MAAPLYVTQSGRLWHAGLILIVTVGLPARGKTHISRALERYLRWLGVKTRVYSLGDYRRKVLGGAKNLPADYFATSENRSEGTNQLRRRVKVELEDQIMDFFEVQGGQVVIYDANNGNVKQRKETLEKFEKQGVHVIFLESVCNDDAIVTQNIRSVKLSSPDYQGWKDDEKIADYWKRIRDQEKLYETVTAEEGPFIKVMNVGERIEVNRIQGYLQSRCCFFLMNIHTRPRTIYFARSGQSLIEHSYRADSDLSPAGWEYADRLKAAVMARRKTARLSVVEKASGEHVPTENPLIVWTSARRRAHHTAWPFVHAGYKVIQKPIMSEINPGVWDGMSSLEARESYPDEWERFTADPYAHRAPRAESYHDLSEPIIFELERVQEDLLIIGHASVLRCLLAYLIGLPPNEVPAVEIARGDLVEVTPASYGVLTNAFHFWSGEGRRDSTGRNLYENFVEQGSAESMIPFVAGTQDMQAEAEQEEAHGKEVEAEAVREALRRRLGSFTSGGVGEDGRRSAPPLGDVEEGEELEMERKEKEQQRGTSSERLEQKDKLPDMLLVTGEQLATGPGAGAIANGGGANSGLRTEEMISPTSEAPRQTF